LCFQARTSAACAPAGRCTHLEELGLSVPGEIVVAFGGETKPISSNSRAAIWAEIPTSGRTPTPDRLVMNAMRSRESFTARAVRAGETRV
jgi:hypothetical protein